MSFRDQHYAENFTPISPGALGVSKIENELV
jgi:hypothetical protein